MKTFSALLALCAWNSPVTGDFPAQRPVTRSFDVFFDERLNKQLSKQTLGWWFETQSVSLWRHSNDVKWLKLERILSRNCEKQEDALAWPFVWGINDLLFEIPKGQGKFEHKLSNCVMSVLFQLMNWRR